MVKERRRYFRQPIKMAVNVVLDDKEVKATSTNISEGGMALMLREALPKGAMPHLTFVLPGINLNMNVEAEVAWVDIKGRVGCRFHNVPQSSQLLLEKWLDDQMEKEFPGSKGRIAAAEAGTTH
jgi:c-di-GMP-binding flagellar brake protein YcgR